MATISYTSRRQYLTQSELAEYADITISDDTEADDQISQAEELIDSYVGFQTRFIPDVHQGKLTSVANSDKELIDTSGDTPFNRNDNYFSYCEIEIIGGTGVGQRGIIESSSEDNKSVTLKTAFATAPDSTSIYKVYQLGKFPRQTDYFYEPDTTTYYKSIPEAVKRAVAAQVEFAINMGSEFFASDATDKQSESIGNYSYSKGNNAIQSAQVKVIAPKAKALLRGIKNSLGELIAENPTDVI